MGMFSAIAAEAVIKEIRSDVQKMDSAVPDDLASCDPQMYHYLSGLREGYEQAKKDFEKILDSYKDWE